MIPLGAPSEVRSPLDVGGPTTEFHLEKQGTVCPNCLGFYSKWGCIKTNLAIFGRMNIHLPVIWGSLGYQGFDSYPNDGTSS